MSASTRIAIDAMGGDFGPRPVLEAVLELVSSHKNVDFVLVGDRNELETQLISLLGSSSLPTRIQILHAPDVVSMDDKPSTALRQKRESSMWKSLELVQSGEVDACVSGGNTGALMAMGRYLVKTWPGIDRPAICKPVPSSKGHCYLLDLGANINCSADHLVQFALMGSVLAAVSDHNPCPSVGLLNIGEENTKGVEQVRLAARVLAESAKINYAGFVEGDDIYTGDVDVVVCDGFVGNIALKVSEGAAKFLAANVRQVFASNWYARFAGWVAAPVVNQWRAKFDPVRHNGACFLGLRGTVVKSHGGADSRGFCYAVQMAIEQARMQIPEKISSRFEELFAQSPSAEVERGARGEQSQY
ncbi:phosphate acyltransferase PlsX [Gilvimarinus sp. F26214L]|uniref:phosphate acyltransferase PlsX n=1 Tax=Gilvimarinus sp. DZF01 TaxID=3461371 RepID=UPI004045CECA